MFTFFAIAEVFARAEDTFEYAKQHYHGHANVLPAPDIAWNLGPWMPSQAQFDILFLMRQDKEAAESESGMQQGLLSPGVSPSNVAQHEIREGGEQRQKYATLLQQLDKQSITYTLRDWDYEKTWGVSFARETSQVGAIQWEGLLCGVELDGCLLRHAHRCR